MSRKWVVPAAVYDAMVEAAEADYPDETCGLLFAREEELSVVRMKNVQNQMHARDPENFPRDARRAYYFDPLEFHRVLEERDARGETMRGIYHSHPDTGAYFSEKDKKDAAPPELGGPLFPDCVYIVLSVIDGKTVDARAFAWDENARDFVERSMSREAPEQ